MRIVPGLCVVLLMASGCSHGPPPAPVARVHPEVRVVSAQKRTITRTTGQPGFIEAYEQTSLYSKVSGFVGVWNVDIGDKVARDEVLAHLDVPELVAEFEEKKAEVELDEAKIQLAKKMVDVALENLKTATAQVDEAKANLGKFAADVERWKADYKRISVLAKSKAVDEQVEDESRKRLQTSVAAQHAGESAVVVAEAAKAARLADLEKARVDVSIAVARVQVARAGQKRLAALVGYTSVKAPYAGIVVARNVNTGDFVQPAAGDQTAARSRQESSQARANPLYVVARTDKVRIFLDVPEMEAAGVHVGNKAWVAIEAVDNEEVSAQVTRTSWALSARTRTLRAEIDIANPGGRILPNMYAFGKVEIKRSAVWTIPLAAVVELGNQTCCYEYRDGKAVVLPIQRGIDDGAHVEVARKRVKGEWRPFDGTERIILGNLAQVSDGESVRLSASEEKQPE